LPIEVDRMLIRSLPIIVTVLACLTAFTPDRASAAEPGQNCRKITHESASYVACAFDLRKHDLRLFLNDSDGAPYGSFRALKADLSKQGHTLPFAMNGGMYHRDRSPVGYYVEGRRKLNEAVTGPGPGNFHMRPNGIFFIEGETVGVMETRAFLKRSRRPDYATQSGPMLVIDGKLHPRFIAGSDFKKRRNGVGIINRHAVVFAISDSAVSFHDLATLFRDRLACRNALFLDGTISSLHAPEIGRSDFIWPVGPIIAVVERAD
jgi:uncharacterized protein YigE (DUF2233 family)